MDRGPTSRTPSAPERRAARNDLGPRLARRRGLGALDHIEGRVDVGAHACAIAVAEAPWPSAARTAPRPSWYRQPMRR
jgi:hypothetical protein